MSTPVTAALMLAGFFLVLIVATRILDALVAGIALP